MNFLSRLKSWLTGKPAPGYKKRITYEGVGLEKVYVFARGREATVEELWMVLQHLLAKVISEPDTGAQSATEEWNPLPGEDESASIQRLADESAARHPGMAVLAFAWPRSAPPLIVTVVTEGALINPIVAGAPHVRSGARP